jgi:hypothetical protein
VSAACWYGPSSALELQLLQPLPSYALEQLRQRFLYALTTSRSPTTSARVLLQMVLDTEISVALLKVVAFPPSTQSVTVCERRHYIDVDSDMRLQSFLVNPALTALATYSKIPTPYVDLLRIYAAADYPRYRMSALASTVLLGVALQ